MSHHGNVVIGEQLSQALHWGLLVKIDGQELSCDTLLISISV